MMIRPPRVPVDLQTQTRFVKERVENGLTRHQEIL